MHLRVAQISVYDENLLFKSVSEEARLQATNVLPAFLSGPVTSTTFGGPPGLDIKKRTADELEPLRNDRSTART